MSAAPTPSPRYKCDICHRSVPAAAIVTMGGVMADAEVCSRCRGCPDECPECGVGHRGEELCGECAS